MRAGDLAPLVGEAGREDVEPGGDRLTLLRPEAREVGVIGNGRRRQYAPEEVDQGLADEPAAAAGRRGALSSGRGRSSVFSG